MIRSVYSVSVYVHNQNEAIRFYREALGFEVRRYEPLGPAGSWVEMAPPGKETALVLYPQAMQPDFQTRRAFVLLQCDDVAAAFETLSNRGVTFTQEPSSLGWGIVAVFADPFGNEIGLLQVTRAAGAVPGAPRGTHGSLPPPPPPPPGKRR
jgi:predicted enzyme related to lactoylglutathione lyase